MFKIGDIVKMDKTYPIWLLSVGLTEQDVGVIIDIVPRGVVQYDPSRTIRVYWFSLKKAFLLDPKTLVKATEE